MNRHKAQGTSLGALLVPLGLGENLRDCKGRQFGIKAAILIALGFLIGGYFGGLWAQRLPEITFAKDIWNFVDNHLLTNHWHPAAFRTINSSINFRTLETIIHRQSPKIA